MHIPPRRDEFSLMFAANNLFAAIASHTPPVRLLSHFSRTEPVVIDHTPIHSPHAYPATGLNAIRSYFDLLSTHWICESIQRHDMHVRPEVLQVVAKASIIWTWRHSGRSWKEDFTCTLDYDDQLKVKHFLVRTTSPPGTCVMMAVDP
jgi:hypothetical protein